MKQLDEEDLIKIMV